ncbi:putative sister chromatid cohesion protein [Diplogelasinospora grovesii]|uniref:Sister chromatid cohesion protein n=1 Tax=Diplogelasinospora grovesii TaxID=303347 RepID=A0AAN6S596_9PEZI|nr:putative sister chromatid cohesion protein [Diplogelasinospora grovesii]
MAPRRSAAAAAAEEEEQQHEHDGETVTTLQFNEALTWRPGKPIPIDQLLKRLNRLSKELSEMDQEAIDPNSLTKVAKEVASHQLLNHKDKGVRAYTACCVVDILRLCAPNAPFTPSQLKDIFNLSVTSIIPALFDPSNPYNNQHKYVLRSFAELKSIVLLLDVEGSETLLLHLFSTIFDGVSGSKSTSREQVAKDVEFTMQELLGVLIDDAASLPAKVVDVIMAQFLRAAAPGGGKERHDHVPIDDNQATLLLKEEPEAYQMAKNICQLYPEKMARFVSQYFSDVIVDAAGFVGKPNGHRGGDDEDDEDGHAGPSESDLKELRKAHTLIREIWKAAPMILQNVVPQVDAELSADHVHLRQLAAETIGDMISGIGAAGPPPPPTLDPAAYPPLRLDDEDRTETPVANILTTPLSAISFSQTHPATFNNFLKRKHDKAGAIRAVWATAAGYILSTSAGGIGLSREDETALVQGLAEKLADSDEKVRLAAVKAIECFRFQDIIMKLAPNGGVNKAGSVLATLADRCRDRKPAVRVAAMSLLARLWAVGTGELLAGHEAVKAALSGVPSRIYNVIYANDLELNVLLDRVIYECLVPLAYPPPRKSSKNANGNSQSQSQSQSQSASANFDQDAIRAERILLLAQSLDTGAKKAFFALQGRQTPMAGYMEALLKFCDQYNGGVMDEDADKKTAQLEKTAKYLAQLLPDEPKARSDILKFAKFNDRRNYNLIKYVIGAEHDFKTVHKALKELIKRVQSSKDPSILDTLLPLLYRAGCLMFNRSHLATIMDYSKSDKDGLGAIAHEILNEISQRNPTLFKTHIGQLCKDLVDQAPSPTSANDPIVAETLKACSSYAQKYPKDIPVDRDFARTLISYALYGRPPKAAKYAVNILTSPNDDRSMVSGTDLLQQTLKDWTYGSAHFLNKLATVSQLELLAPKITEEAEDSILNMTVQQILLKVRTEARESDADWVEDADVDEECQAKCLALKTLVNRLRSMEDETEAKEKAKPVWKMLRQLIVEKGEICKTKNTPKHHKARLRLLAAQLLLKLCTQKHFDELLTAQDFNILAFTTQDAVQEVRHGFVQKLQKYLADNRLKSRYYTIIFLMAFEPNTEFKQRVETWIRSRARYFRETKQPFFEANMPRLLSLLAHHPDYSPELDELVDHARYILFYIGLVATEANLGQIYKYAERVKQTQDALGGKESNNHRVLSDLAQAVIRKWQEKKNWVFSAYPGKVGLPVGLYLALQSHDEAQQVAETQYCPEGIDEKLEELLRAMDRKKKRKSAHDGDGDAPQAAKKARVAVPKITREPKEPRVPKPVKQKTAASSSAKAKKTAAATTPKRKKKEATSSSPVDDANRRRSGRARRTNTSYIERDDDEDDEEMLDGVAQWDYEGNSDEDEDEDMHDESSAEEPETADGDKEDAESEVEDKGAHENGAKPKATPAKKPTKKTTAAKEKNGDGEDSDLSDLSELSDVEVDEDKDEDKAEEEKDEQEEGDEEKEDGDEEKDEDVEEEEEQEEEPAPRTRRGGAAAANGRKAKAPPAKPKPTPKGKTTTRGAAAAKKSSPVPAPTRATRGRTRATAKTNDEMDED